MKKYHITYYTQRTPSPMLAGVTLEAINMIDALDQSLTMGISIQTIKYIIEL
jgi:hypothetical protein